MQTAVIETKVGFLGASWSEKGLFYLSMPQASRVSAAEELVKIHEGSLNKTAAGDSFLDYLASLLRAYFEGKMIIFDVKVDFSGYTSFTKKILQLTAGIPYGKVCTYGELAGIAEKKRGARAVGQALGANRTPLVIPCHRIIRSNGSLGGFSGGLEWKKFFLQLEGYAF